MAREESIIRFAKVSFGYGHDHPILDGVDFPIRRGAKLAVMGQNGAGKSTLFSLMTGALAPDAGKVEHTSGLTVATAPQVVPREERELTVRMFFAKRFNKPVYDIDPRIDAVLEEENLEPDHERTTASFRGGKR